MGILIITGTNGTRPIIDGWVFIKDYQTISGLGYGAIRNRMKYGMLEWKRERNKFLIHCKLIIKDLTGDSVKLNTNIMETIEKEVERIKLPSKLQPEDLAYLYVTGDNYFRIMPYSVGYLFVPCLIIAVKFTPSQVLYDVQIELSFPGQESEKKTRLHGISAALVYTTQEYYNFKGCVPKEED